MCGPMGNSGKAVSSKMRFAKVCFKVCVTMGQYSSLIGGQQPPATWGIHFYCLAFMSNPRQSGIHFHSGMAFSQERKISSSSLGSGHFGVGLDGAEQCEQVSSR